MEHMKTASLGTVSHATLRAEDLIGSFLAELEYQLNRQERTADNREELDKLNNFIGEIQDECYDDDGGYIESENDMEIVSDLIDRL